MFTILRKTRSLGRGGLLRMKVMISQKPLNKRTRKICQRLRYLTTLNGTRDRGNRKYILSSCTPLLSATTLIWRLKQPKLVSAQMGEGILDKTEAHYLQLYHQLLLRRYLLPLRSV